jgi:excisionase family DNA binding protein
MSSQAPEVEDDRLHPAPWAAEFVNLGLNTIYILARAGKIPHYRIGSSVRFRKSDLERWLESQRRGTA